MRGAAGHFSMSCSITESGNAPVSRSATSPTGLKKDNSNNNDKERKEEKPPGSLTLLHHWLPKCVVAQLL